MRSQKFTHRMLSCLLAVLLVCSMAPVGAFAEQLPSAEQSGESISEESAASNEAEKNVAGDESEEDVVSTVSSDEQVTVDDENKGGGDSLPDDELEQDNPLQGDELEWDSPFQAYGAEGGSVTVDPAITGGTVSYTVDSDTIIVAVAPEGDNKLGCLAYYTDDPDQLTGISPTGTANQYSFEMPAEPVTITATFGPFLNDVYMRGDGNDANAGTANAKKDAILTFAKAKSLLANGGAIHFYAITVSGSETWSLAGYNASIRRLNEKVITYHEVTVKGSLTLEDVTFDGSDYNKTPPSNSCIYIDGGTVNIKDGTRITGFSGKKAAVAINKGTLNMKGGEISGNTNTSVGGGVSLAAGTTFNMSGGIISGNTAKNGGGVSVGINGAVFDMSGGGVSGNTSTAEGGGVYLQNGIGSGDGSFNMTGGTISGNRMSTSDSYIDSGIYVSKRSESPCMGQTTLGGSAMISDPVFLGGSDTFIAVSDELTSTDPIEIQAENQPTADSPRTAVQGTGTYTLSRDDLKHFACDSGLALRFDDDSKAIQLAVPTYPVSFVSDHASVTVGGNPVTAANVAGNGSLTFTVTPESGYGISSVTSDKGTVTDNKDGTYTLADVTGDTIVTVSCYSGLHGVFFNSGAFTVTVAGEPVTESTIEDGGTLNFVVTPAKSLIIAKVEADHGKLADNGGGSYTLSEAAEPTTVTVAVSGEEPAEVTDITTAEELFDFAAAVNAGETYEGKTVRLKADIDLKDAPWTPIGSYDYVNHKTHPFSGTFDGGGHAVRGLNAGGDTGDMGLFGIINAAVIKNLTLYGQVSGGGTISDGTNTGAVAGRGQGYSTFINCVNYATVKGLAGPTAGILGNGSASIYNCINYGDVTTETGDAAGIANLLGTVRDCANYGVITGGKKSGLVAGIVNAFNSNSEQISIDSCYNAGEINSMASYTGGIVSGSTTNGTSTMSNCYNTGSVTSGAESQVADTRPNDSMVGGLAGYFRGTIANCYNAGAVIHTNVRPGTVSQLVADAVFLTASNCFTSTDTFTAGDLGRAFKADVNGVNGGLPILVWQSDTASDTEYPVSFVLTSASGGSITGAAVTVYSDSAKTRVVSPGPDGSWKVRMGQYFYTVTAPGCKTVEGAFSVVSSEKSIAVTLQQASTVIFQVSPAAAELSVIEANGASNEIPLSSGSGTWTYQLVVGKTYEYSATAEGYTSVTEVYTVSEAGETISVKLAALPSVPSENSISGGSVISKGGSYTIKSGAKGTISINTTDPVTLIGRGINKTDKYVDLTVDCIVSGVNLTIQDLYIKDNESVGTTADKGIHIINFTGRGNQLYFTGESLLENQGYAQSAGIHVGPDDSLVIDGSGALYIYKYSQGAGIGGDANESNGNITLAGGDIFIKGSKTGPLIGNDVVNGEPKDVKGKITISGGNVNLINKAQGAAIGGSRLGPGGNVSLEGGNLTIITDYTGSAVGGGAQRTDSSESGKLTVSGGSFKAVRTANSYYGENPKLERAKNGDSATQYVDDSLVTAEKSAYLCIFDTTKLAKSGKQFDVKVDGADFYSGGLHLKKYTESTSSTKANWGNVKDNNVYLYLSGADHTLTVNNETFTATWDKDSESFTVTGGSSGAAASSGISEPVAKATLDVEAVMSGTKGTAEVTESAMSDAIKSALEKAEEKDIAAAVEISVSASSTAAQINTVVPTASLKALAKSDVKYLIIDTPVGNITLDSQAIASVADKAGGGQTTFGISMTAQSALTAAQKEAAGTGLVVDISITSNNKTISDLGGGTAIVSIPYTLEDGESAEGVAVWYLADDGSLTRIENAKYSKGYAVFALEHFSRYLIGYDPMAGWANPFADVAKTDWFYENVYYAYTKGLFQGTGATTFEPGSPMDRAMLVTVLWRLDGKPSPSAASSFKDVKAGVWYADAVSWASENKIVEGYSKDRFGTTDQITREQISAILYRYGKLKDYTLAAGADLSKYTDGGKLASWAAESMSWANAAGIITGRTADTLAPGSSATRAEVAAMIQRFAESASTAGEQAVSGE